MGSDLSIQSISRPLQDKHQQTFHAYARRRDAATTEDERKRFQRKVEEAYAKMYSAGYFRDSYNNSNLLWKLGLDYWEWFAA
jgi:phosphopentomutase